MQQYFDEQRTVLIINVLTSVFPKAKPLGFWVFFEGVIGVRVSRSRWENIPWMRRVYRKPDWLKEVHPGGITPSPHSTDLSLQN